MIYTIGYQGMDINFFMKALKGHDIKTLIDVRSKPTGWNPAFREKAMENRTAREGIKYLWRGRTLGGFSKISEGDIISLIQFCKGKKACLMCMEADPLKCHRHYELAERLKEYGGVRVTHIIKDPGSPTGTRAWEVEL